MNKKSILKLFLFIRNILFDFSKKGDINKKMHSLMQILSLEENVGKLVQFLGIWKGKASALLDFCSNYWYGYEPLCRRLM